MFHLKSKCVFILFALFWAQAAAVGEVNISSDNFTFTYNSKFFSFIIQTSFFIYFIYVHVLNV